MKIGRRTYTKKDGVNTSEIHAFVEELRTRLGDEVDNWEDDFGILQGINDTIDRFQRELLLIK